MIRIFNRKLQFEISIDEIDQVIFTPRDYEDVPFVKIELRNFDFHRHSKTCKDCGAFISAFGTNSMDWFINYSGKIRRLDLSYFGSEFSDNHSQFKMSEFGNISILKLNLSTLPDSQEELNALLQVEIVLENYERCSLLRDIINNY